MAAERQGGDWAPEVAEWMAETSVCAHCGAKLARNPHLIGSWMAEVEGRRSGVCSSNPVQYAGGAPHVAGEVVPGDR